MAWSTVLLLRSAEAMAGGTGHDKGKGGSGHRRLPDADRARTAPSGQRQDLVVPPTEGKQDEGLVEKDLEQLATAVAEWCEDAREDDDVDT